MRARRSVTAAVLLSTAALAAVTPARATMPGRDGLILFSADTGSGYQIYTTRSNGHGLTQVTHVSGDAVNGDWSPDGRRIAFELDTDDGAELALMDADGADLTLIAAPAGTIEADPSFTPDGEHLVYEQYDYVDNIDAIYRMNLDGSGRTLVTTGLVPSADGGGVTDPNVSPDGSRISFLQIRGNGDTALATAGVDGSDPSLLTSYDLQVAFKHDWAPDGRHLVISDNADDLTASANVAEIGADGTGLRYLTHYTDPQERGYVGGYSPNGHWIVFRHEDHGRFELLRMKSGGGRPQVLLGLSSFKPRFIDWGSAPCCSDGD